MALSIFSKVTLIAKAGAHSLLDKQIDAHSVEAHEQLIRELETAIQSESTETIRAEVAAKSLHLQVTAIQKQIDEFNAAIETNLNDGDPTNDHEAETMMTHVIELEQERDSIKSQEDSTNENHTLLADTLEKLRERHKKMVSELNELRRAVSQAKTDNQALKAVRQAKDLTEGVDSAHLGGALDKARQDSEVARAELKDAVGSIQSTPEALLQKNQAAARIVAMRAKIVQPAT